MKKQYPAEMIAASNRTGVKLAIEMIHETAEKCDCPNCSGMGYLYLFIASEGPFSRPGPIHKISKWHGNAWWIGDTMAFICPVCKGIGRQR